MLPAVGVLDDDYEPVKRAEAIVTQLERCIELGPRHPGAHHLYIHIVESSGRAERGVASADLLGERCRATGFRPYALPHLHQRGPLRRRDPRQPARGRAR